MIPSTKVVPMSLLKYKTKEVNSSSRLKKLLQKSTLVLLMFMTAGCVSRDSDAEYCTDMRVVPTQEFKCTYMNPWSMICSRKRVYKPVCARWAQSPQVRLDSSGEPWYNISTSRQTLG